MSLMPMAVKSLRKEGESGTELGRGMYGCVDVPGCERMHGWLLPV